MGRPRFAWLNGVFAPAVRLMGGLSHAGQFLLLSTLSLTAVIVLLMGFYQSLSQVIQRSDRELAGLAQIDATLRAIQAVQKHRGISQALLSGQITMRDRQRLSVDDVDAALDFIRPLLPDDAELIAAFEDIQGLWQRVKQHDAEGVGLSESFAFHSSLVARMMRLQALCRDRSMLIVDGDPGTRYLIELLSRHLPESLESMAQLRDRGVVMATRNTMSIDQRIAVSVVREDIAHHAAKTKETIEDARRYNRDLTDMLRQTERRIAASGQRMEQWFDYAAKPLASMDAESVFVDVTVAIDAVYSHIYSSFLPTTQGLIQSRMARAQRTLWVAVSIPASLFLLLIYFAVGSHLAMSRNIAALARSAKAFSEGDMTARLVVPAGDEIGQIAVRFNAMADRFVALLARHEVTEKRLQSIIDTALEAVVQMDALGRIRGWNGQAERTFGWRAFEVMGLHLHDVLAPERFRDAQAFGLQRFLETGMGDFLNRRVEINALHRDGHEFPIEIAITPNHLNGTTEFSAFIRDMSGHKRALQDLQTSELRYRMLFESSRDAIVTLSATKGILSANTAAVDLFAASDAGALTSKLFDALSPECQFDGERSAVAAKARLAQALSQGFSEFEWVFQRFDGGVFIAEVHMVRFEVNDDVLLQASLRDITERKQAKQAMITSEARVRAILRTMKDAVLQIDARGRILLINEAATELFGYEEDELIGRNVSLLMPEPHASQHDEYLRRHAEQQHRVIIGRRVEFEGRHRSGELIPIELSVNEALDDFGRTYIGVIRDIRQRRLIELERETARQQAEQLAHAKSEFLANMSHEIRTPLNAIIGLAKMGLREYADADSNAAVHFDRIRQAGRHLLNIVNDVLDFSKLEAGKMTIDPHPFHLAALIDDAVALVEMRAREKQLRLKIDKQADLPEWVVGDSLRLRQILVNLLSNAIKFTELGYVSIKVARSGNDTRFTVADSGIGMSPTQMSRLFNAFEQADGSTTRKFGGSGLGLAISRNLARLMGGDIVVSSVFGVGSEFLLTLPLGQTQPPVNPLPVLPGDRPRLSGVRALAAEDVELNRMILDDLLLHEGADVIFAANGQEALEKLDAMNYAGVDVVLMDIQMPVLDGYQAARIVRQRAPQLPIIGLTAHAMPEERQRCLDAGMRDHVTKPIEIDELVAAIRQCLDNVGGEPAPESPGDEQASMPTVDVRTGSVDWAAVLERFGGRRAFVMKLVDNALDASQLANIEKLRAAADARDYAAVKFIAHSLKGLAGVFLNDRLLTAAQEAEQAAKQQVDDCAATALVLAERLQDLIDELNQYRELNLRDESQST